MNRPSAGRFGRKRDWRWEIFGFINPSPGFFADLTGPAAIRLQTDELAEARWFSRQALPTDHSADSLTGEMIEVFRSGAEPK